MRITGVSPFPASLSRPGSRQRGIALAVALFLLILITLIGLVAIRGTTVQQRMTANFYDRELAFQKAEAGLRAGQAVLAERKNVDKYRDCVNTSATPCAANPFMDSALDATNIMTAATEAETATAGQYTAEGNAPGQPQFVIELICDTNCTAAGDPGECQSANCQSYGTQSGESTVWYYRITARSGDPDSVEGANRAVVTLQAMFAVPPAS
jgi:type IV pilus assembly protein PilX